MTACGRRDSCHQALLLADSLAYADPARAMGIIDSIGDAMSGCSRSDRMRWQLVRLKAADELGHVWRNDSVVLPILEYYSGDSEPDTVSAEAFYYGGRVYTMLGDAPQSLSWFRKATDRLGDAGSPRLRQLIHNQSGSLYSRQRLYNEAVKEYGMALRYSQQLNDYPRIISDQIYLGKAYHGLRNNDSALHYLDKARLTAMFFGDSVRAAHIRVLESMIYMDIDSMCLARSLLLPYLRVDIGGYTGEQFMAVGRLYHLSGQSDSAEAYYLRLVNDPNLTLRQEAFHQLGHIEIDRNNPWKAMMFITKALRLRDTIEHFVQTQGVQQVNAIYNYEMRERETLRLKDEVGRVRRVLLWTIGIVAVVAVIAILYAKYMSLKRRQLRARIRAIEQIRDEQFKRSREYAGESLARIHELESRIYDAGCENERLKSELEERKRDYELSSRSASLELERRTTAETRFFNSEFYIGLRAMLDSPDTPNLSSDDWDRINRYVNDTYPGFENTLRGAMGLSEHEYRITLLIKIGMQPNEIARFVNRSKEAVSSTRRRLFERLFSRKGTGKDWDKFVESL
ncbi:MAG: hypothetical protein NC117_02045 [Pseudoflavonifractor sp.]|nr:hypothetical protein [Pseudoflavonifractor sp.]